MSEKFNSQFTSLADIAKTMCDTFPYCCISYIGADEPGIRFLCVKGTGLFLRDIRPYLDDTIGVQYGVNQDTILFYYF